MKIKSAEENRAYIEGVYDATEKILDEAATYWKMDRDEIDLEYLKSVLFELRTKTNYYLMAAQDIERSKINE